MKKLQSVAARMYRQAMIITYVLSCLYLLGSGFGFRYSNDSFQFGLSWVIELVGLILWFTANYSRRRALESEGRWMKQHADHEELRDLLKQATKSAHST